MTIVLEADSIGYAKMTKTAESRNGSWMEIPAVRAYLGIKSHRVG